MLRTLSSVGLSALVLVPVLAACGPGLGSSMKSPCLDCEGEGQNMDSAEMGPKDRTEPLDKTEPMEPMEKLEFDTDDVVGPENSLTNAPRLWSKHYGPDDESSCVGRIEPPDPGYAQEFPQDSLSAAPFLGRPGQGRLCKAKVYKVTRPGGVKVYRAWSSRRPREFGQWWSLHVPAGPVAKYREVHGMCPAKTEKEKLDMITMCDLRVGVEFAVGPGQSKTCHDGVTIGQTAVNQVYVPVPRGNPVELWFENCKAVDPQSLL